MNIQQLEYLVAIDEYQHFQKAAEACFITPATLSIMVKKLEEELGVILFDRTKHPIVATDMGRLILRHARDILATIRQMKEAVKQAGSEMKGELRIGVIPTLAPYLLHLFLPGLLRDYPDLILQIKELPTDQLIEHLKKDLLDVGILVVPEGEHDLHARFLFHEKLLVFVSEADHERKYILPSDIDIHRLWLLEGEHCLRSQIMNLCSLKKKAMETQPLKFDAGSIETLLQIVEMQQGITIIPELSAQSFSAARKKQLRYFQKPEPVREISMVMYRPAMKEKMVKALEQTIKIAVKPFLSAVEEHSLVSFSL